MKSLQLSRNISQISVPVRLQNGKAKSLLEICKRAEADQFNTLQEFNMEFSPIMLKKMNIQSLISYTSSLACQVYNSDLLGIGKMINEFLANELPKQRQRVHQRLSLLKHQAQTLKFNSFEQIQLQIIKQWHKNVLFFSLSTIWITRILTQKFSSIAQFMKEYKKQVVFICNLTHFYFKDALSILDGPRLATLSYLEDQTAHKIINSLQDWKLLYEGTIIPLLRDKNFSQQPLIDFQYDLKSLHINQEFLDLQSGQPELVQTTQKIRQIANECTIHGKIQLLKEFRAIFLKQIQQNRAKIAKKKDFEQFSTLKKDDVIGCMIYCIVTGKIQQIKTSLQSLSLLLGPRNELLSLKGVDSYRADLQSAVDFLCQQRQAIRPEASRSWKNSRLRA